MDKLEHLKRFITAVATGDDATVEEAFHAYSKMKSKDILQSAKSNLLESHKKFAEFKRQLLEYIGDEPIALDGEKVLVNGKIVGRVSVDHEDMESGINFTTMDGQFSKEFDDVEALFQYLHAQYLGEKR